jgi:hypothetical protein
LAAKPAYAPHKPTEYDNHDAGAMRALVAGVASPEQQKLAFDWWIRASGYYDLSYYPGDTHATAFSEGKRFLGAQAIKLSKSPAK